MQFKCGKERKVLLGEWKVPEKITWKNLSPQDWIAILASLSLVWNQQRFIEDFGPEKVNLDVTLAMFRIAYNSVFGLSLNSDTMSMEGRIEAYKDAIKRLFRGKDKEASI